MEIDKVFSSDVDGVADNLFSAVKNSVSEIKAMQQRKAAENVQLVIQALKKIESDLQDKFDGVTTVIEKRVATIKDGRDGLDGRNGRDGKDGRPGRDGAPGARGPAGVPGTNGRDGEDGVSVTDAKIDFDGSLVISLSSGREINVGEVVAPDLAEKIKVITNGGGTSQSVLDSLASLQAQINAISNFGAVNYVGTWNADTNTPTIVNGTGDKGDYYVVSVAGATNIDGQTLWGVGDWIIFNGVVWQRVDGGSTGNFTDLSASGVVTLSGGTADSVLYLNGSKVVSSTSNFGFNGATQVTLNFGSGTNGWNAAYSRYLVGKTTLAGASSSSISHLTSNLHDTGAGTGTWQYMLSASNRGSVLTQFNGTLSWAATALAGTGGNTATVSNILQASHTGAVTLNSSGRPGSLINYGTAEITDAVTLSGGTANGVAYLNGSKVLTTGSALRFDGDTLFSPATNISNSTNLYNLALLRDTSTSYGESNFYVKFDNSTSNSVGGIYHPEATSLGVSAETALIFGIGTSSGATEKMRLTSTTLSLVNNPTLSGGTANGVAYLNGSKVLTTGSALTFDGTTFKSPILFASSTDASGNVLQIDTTSTVYGRVGGSTTMGYVAGTQSLWTIGGSESMRLTSTGLGIGTSSPLARLHVSQLSTNTAIGTSGAQGLYMTNPGTTVNAFSRIDFSGSSNGATASIAAQFTNYATGATDLVFGTYGGAAILERMRLDSSGNLGLGVTPSAWRSNTPAFQVGSSGVCLFSDSGVVAGLGNNMFLNASSQYIYQRTDLASRYQQYQGVHAWFTAPSGTAGNAISFTQAMTLDASGNLLVGTTSTSLSSNGFIAFPNKTQIASDNVGAVLYLNKTSTNGDQVYFYNNANFAGFIGSTTSSVSYNTSSDYRLKEDVQPMTGALAKVAALKPCTYKWKVDGSAGEGFIAHELAEVVPQAVTGSKDAVNEDGSIKPQGIDTSFLVATLTAAIQELKAEFDAYKATHP